MLVLLRNILLSSKTWNETKTRLSDFGFLEVREHNYANITESSLVIETTSQRDTPIYSGSGTKRYARFLFPNEVHFISSLTRFSRSLDVKEKFLKRDRNQR